ncbi:MAG: NAD(P)/FAD-dependent oxidoreductase, partial [Dehalococcoidia bacterium]|nr:NAD(P)/FAD-dependent oxidoreductase [Dehalococcoidia bacterium]
IDRNLKTSHAGVYACGDMSEGYDFLLKINRLLPIWPAAYIGGRTAGFNMAGRNTEYDGATVMNAMNYFSFPLVVAGLVNLEKEEGYEVMTSLKSSMYRKIVLKDNRVVGLLYTGAVDRAGIVYGLMKDGIDVSAFKGELISPSFGMASMPEALRKERMKLIVNSHEKEKALQRA